MLAHGRVFYKKSTSFKKVLLCDRDRIQTCNRLIRSQLLYSVELRGLVCFTGAKIRTFFELARDTQTFFEKNYSINR